MENIKKIKFFNCKLAILLKVSDILKQKIVLFLIVVDKPLLLGQTFIFFVCVVFYLFHFFTFHIETHLLYSLLFVQFEFFLSVYQIYQILRAASFYVACSWFATAVFTRHAKAFYFKVKQLLKNSRKKHYQIVFDKQHHVIDQMIRKHNKICYLVVRGSEDLFGSVMFVFLLTNVPINVYIFWRIIFQKRTLIDMFVYWIVILLQVGAAITVFSPLAYSCGVYHSPKKFLLVIQKHLQGKQWVQRKLKIDDLYFRLIQGPKLAVSIGFLRAVTYLATLEVSF